MRIPSLLACPTATLAAATLLLSRAPSQTLVKDISAIITNNGSTPGAAYDTGVGYALFAANNGSNGTELWRTDGTLAGTVLVKDINTTSSTASSSPDGFFTYAGRT